MMLLHGGGKRARTPQKMGIEKLALTNNMAAGIRTLLVVPTTGTLSNDPSPSQLLRKRPPARRYCSKCRKMYIV